MKWWRGLAGFVMVTASVTACGGSSGSVDPGSNDSGDTPASCSDTPRPELGAPDGWSLCVDSGLLETTDEFSFENWGGPVTSDSYTADLMVAIFGIANVCMPDAVGCVLYPAAQQWMDQMNSAIEGGRCEGMATLSQRLHMGRDTPDVLQVGATTTADLSRDSYGVGTSIAKWWASQTFDVVRETTEPTREWPPSRVVNELVNAIRDSAGPTLGLYGNGQAHAVTPIAISTDNGGSYIVHVYDNNYPGRILPLHVDANTETWSYDMAAANSGESSETWGGGAGTLDLTLMDSREAPTSAPWSDASATKGSTVVTASTRGSAVVGLRISTGSTVVDTRDPSTWAAGVRVFPLSGALAGTGVSVIIPSSTARATVTPVVGAAKNANPVDLTMTFDFPGRGSTQFSAEVPADGSDTGLPDFSFDDDGGDYSFEVDGSGDFDLEYAFGEEEADYDLSGDVTLRVVESDDSTDLSLLDADGNEVWRSEFDGEDDDGVYGSFDINFDEDTGTIEVSETAFEAYDEADQSEEESSVSDSTVVEDDSVASTEPADPSGDQSGGVDSTADDTTP